MIVSDAGSFVIATVDQWQEQGRDPNETPDLFAWVNDMSDEDWDVWEKNKEKDRERRRALWGLSDS